MANLPISEQCLNGYDWYISIKGGTSEWTIKLRRTISRTNGEGFVNLSGESTIVNGYLQDEMVEDLVHPY